MYAIIDIETTGLSPKTERITEIAIFIFDGYSIVDEYVTIINPERSIPYFITRLTGINNQTVENAPKFYEVAKKIVELTENQIFVAHNADFDYNFIRHEFLRLGYKFKRKKLCTVKLSRKLMPGLPSYSLGKICDYLDIQNDSRHRAAGDALATVELFKHLLSIDAENKPILSFLKQNTFDGQHPHLKRSTLDDLPEEAGVYYFYDEKQQLIYIGKSKNIQKRVLSHFQNNSTKKAIEMRSRIADISYELTGSELLALLLESDEIKKHKPIFNRAQRRSSFNFGVFSFHDEFGYRCFKIEKNKPDSQPVSSFNSRQSAIKYLEYLLEKFDLCQKLTGVYDSKQACFNYEVKKCAGACIQKESVRNYNLRAEKALQSFAYKYDSFILIDEGRTPSEKALVRVQNGKYKGFGYIDTDLITNDLELIMDCIKPYTDNRDVQQIIKNYLRKNKLQKLEVKNL